ncbi:hypothetical protein BDQ17DRAFT_1348874 [Cyathus striatus]|nr:hypothetical protein BDQ17DRAFT_1348874 [Cyathus striatus]
MPVPPPHPILKIQNQCGDRQTSLIRNLTRTLPVSPTGPPPSFGTREEWINSLPSWRRTKPRRIWEDDGLSLPTSSANQDFCKGLTVVDNTSVIKGSHAEACIPPNSKGLQSHIHHHQQHHQQHHHQLEVPASDDADDEMSDYYPTQYVQSDVRTYWTDPPSFSNPDQRHRPLASQDRSHPECAPIPPSNDDTYERGAFTPVFEDQSPGGVSGPDGSSPVTPFAEYIDRAVTTADSYGTSATGTLPISAYKSERKTGVAESYEQPVTYPSIAVQPDEEISQAQEVTPSANFGYKKLAEPLSEWIANYVWKICATGYSLPHSFAQSSNVLKHYPSSPPSYLAPSVHTLLMSTLLQPSAVFLAVWYIARLPVFFNAIPGSEHVKALRFRVALLGEGHTGFEKDSMEYNAPFRLIVLGCMLANKWLDDHTFSNKTWHTISNIPIHTLNQLEALALDMFSYDLSISCKDWTAWLRHLMSYHMSLNSPSHPQPISRPSTNPHSIIRKSLDEIIQASIASIPSPIPQPIFLGLEERKKEKLEQEQAIDMLEIDLDEDGPLREEYLPRRRISGTGSFVPSSASQSNVQQCGENNMNWEKCSALPKVLPPPARWSPSGDEPILRERNRISGHYVAVQPSQAPTYGSAYHQSQEAMYNPNWPTAGHYLHIKQAAPYVYDIPATQYLAQPVFNNYCYPPTGALAHSQSHSRSHSMSYEQDIAPRNHIRSYSQSQFDYGCNDIRMTVNEQGSSAATRWPANGQYPYASNCGQLPGLGMQSNWLRA